ncbi:MAG: FkbM family methyltransferase [Planctomycetota bacterium]
MFGPLHALHANPLLRKVALPLLRSLNPGDITLRHHYTGAPVRLHSFRHKGYWFHGRRREQETMEFFRRLLAPGDCVIEVGGHIGYISLYFADLVGPAGRVMVFEPGSNNIPYIRQNVASIQQIDLKEVAVSDQDGIASFFEEELTGQNNSLHADYDVFQENRHRAFASEEYSKRRVETIRLDTLLSGEGLTPDLIKIDIEGAELMALKGARETLSRACPVVMVEVTRQKAEVFAFFEGLGYQLFNDTGVRLDRPDAMDFNVCALHPEKHVEKLDQLSWNRAQAA